MIDLDFAKTADLAEHRSKSLVQHGGMVLLMCAACELSTHALLQTTAQDAYLDSPSPRHGQFPISLTSNCETSPNSACSEVAIKQHHSEPPAYPTTPYLDSPPLPCYDNSPTNSVRAPNHQPLSFNTAAPPNRSSHSNDYDDENVPLAQLLLYPRDAPPAYSTVVGQSYNGTLQHQHMPRNPEVVDIDEEAGLEMIRADDVSFRVERAVATAVVMALLVLAGLLMGWLFLR